MKRLEEVQPVADEWCEHALIDAKPLAATFERTSGRTLNLCIDCTRKANQCEACGKDGVYGTCEPCIEKLSPAERKVLAEAHRVLARIADNEERSETLRGAGGSDRPADRELPE